MGLWLAEAPLLTGKRRAFPGVRRLIRWVV